MDRKPTDRQTERLAGAARESERRPTSRTGGLRAAGIAASRIAAPIVARRGGGLLARLKAEWTAIVGTDMAGICWPETLGRDGALKLRVPSAHALGLQHRAPLLIERINAYLGRPAVTRIALVQGTLPFAAAPAVTNVPPQLTGIEEQTLDAQLSDVTDPELRAALAGLGRLVVAGSRPPSD